MLRLSWLVLAIAVVGCGTPATENTSAPAGDEAATPAGSGAKPAGSDSKGSASKEDVTVTQVAFNADGAPVVEFEAPGMHCEFCAATIVGLLKDKPGVVDVMADAETKVVTVAVEEAEFESEKIVEAIADAGFAEAPEESGEAS
ncbi:MAG: heavy-metal-associated domain-containing protein [Planctomycetota bacterium]